MENTPIQFLDTEQENALYIKRDDLIPYSFGGNKARKACLFSEDRFGSAGSVGKLRHQRTREHLFPRPVPAASG